MDEQGAPVKKPVFLLATQNPVSFSGRQDEDTALRRRLVKFDLDWPVFQQHPVGMPSKNGLFKTACNLASYLSSFIPETRKRLSWH